MMEARDSIETAGRMPAARVRASAPTRLGRLRLALRVCGFAALAALALFAGGFGWFADKVSHMTTPLNPAFPARTRARRRSGA